MCLSSQDAVRKCPFAQTLRNLKKIMLAGKLDSDIKYMAVLIFFNFSILNKMAILGQDPNMIEL